MSLRERPTEERAPGLTGSSEHIQIVEQALRSEFGEMLAPEAIARVAVEAVARFDHVPVQTFVPILAIRDAQQRARTIAHETTDRPSTATASATAPKVSFPPLSPGTP